MKRKPAYTCRFNNVRAVTLLPYFGPEYPPHLNPVPEHATSHIVSMGRLRGTRRVAGIVPDVLIGTPDLSALYGDTVRISDYALVGLFRGSTIWKGVRITYTDEIYLRRDLLPLHPGLTELRYTDPPID
jgi:hypothetical protein